MNLKTHLCFHGIGRCVVEREPGEARYWMDEGLFLSVLDDLQGMADVELSFDDGNRSDIEIVLPALRERGLRATFFPLAGRLDDPVSLSPSALRELRSEGMTVGSHGWDHVPWRGLSKAARRREFVDARSALAEASGAEIATAAFPLGRYERASLRDLKAAGYAVVYSSDRFRARTSAWLQARYSVTVEDTRESVASIVHAAPGLRDVRNLGASMVKRLR